MTAILSEGNEEFGLLICYLITNIRFRWIADLQNVQLECLLYTESGRSDLMFEPSGDIVDHFV